MGGQKGLTYKQQKIDNIKTIFWETMFLFFNPIPYWDHYVLVTVDDKVIVYLLSDFMMTFMWIRIYNLIRTIFTHSIYMDAYSK